MGLFGGNGFNIDKASQGVSVDGTKDYLKKLRMDVFDKAKSTITNEVKNCENEIKACWSGQSADAFMKKLENDSKTVKDNLDKLEDAITAQFNNIIKMAYESDQSVADKIKSM